MPFCSRAGSHTPFKLTQLGDLYDLYDIRPTVGRRDYPTQPKLLHPLTAKLTVLLTDGYQYVDRSWRPQSFCYVCCPAMIFDHIVTTLKARRWSHEIRVGPYIICSHLNHLWRLKYSVTPSKDSLVVCLPDNFFFQQLECLVTFSIKKRDIEIEDTRKAVSQIFLSSRRSSRCPRHALRHTSLGELMCVSILERCRIRLRYGAAQEICSRNVCNWDSWIMEIDAIPN